MSKYSMSKFNSKQYLYFAENSAANFYLGGRKEGGYAVSQAASRQAPSRAPKKAVAGRAKSAAADEKPADVRKNAEAASVTSPAFPSASPETAVEGVNSDKPDKAAFAAENLKSGSFFRGENLLNGIIMAEILGKPKYLRKGRW